MRRGAGMRPDVLHVLLYVQVQRVRVPDQVARRQRILVLEQQVVHLPELSLQPGRLGRLGGCLGPWVHL